MGTPSFSLVTSPSHDRLVVVEDFAVEAPKTKALLGKLDGMGLSDVLIVTEAVDQNLYLAARNLPHVDVRDVQGSDPVSLIAFDKEFLARPIGSGVTTLGIPIAFGVIVFTIAITGLYVRRANSEYDRLTAQLLEDAAR